MNEKYIYTGPDNERCPVCGSRDGVGPPIIYFIGERRIAQHKWCLRCFSTVYKLSGAAINEKQIELLIPDLTKYAVKALGPALPDDHEVKGFFFANVPKQGLTLVMELRHEW